MTKLLNREDVWFSRAQEYVTRLWVGWYMACAGDKDAKVCITIVNLSTREVKRLVLYKRQVLRVVSPETITCTNIC
jgi:hypothetical protein